LALKSSLNERPLTIFIKISIGIFIRNKLIQKMGLPDGYKNWAIDMLAVTNG
jgi:hypothetical protein